MPVCAGPLVRRRHVPGVLTFVKRRLTVPAGLATATASSGDYARFDAKEDALVFRRLPHKGRWLTVLRACPVSPDEVPRRREPARRRKL